MNKLYTIGIIALVLIAALFVGCSSSDQVTTQPSTTGTDSVSAPTTANPAASGTDLTLVTQDDTEIGEMI